MAEELLPSPIPSARETKAFEDALKIRERYSGDAEIKGYIEQIRGADGQFAVMQEICNEHLREVDSELWRVLRTIEIVQAPPEEFSPSERERHLMSTTNLPAVILVNDTLLRKSFPTDLKMVVLHGVLHEIAHTLPIFRAFTSPSGGPPMEILGTLIGSKGAPVLLYLLNETLTDELGGELATAFADRTGYATPEEVHAFYARLRSGDMINAKTRKLYDAMVRKMAERRGIPIAGAKTYLKTILLLSANPLFEDAQGKTVLSVISDDENFGRDLSVLKVEGIDPFIEKYLS